MNEWHNQDCPADTATKDYIAKRKHTDGRVGYLCIICGASWGELASLEKSDYEHVTPWILEADHVSTH